MCQLEIIFYAIFWNGILERFDSTNYLLSDSKIVHSTAVNVLISFLSFVQKIRNTFEDYEEKAKKNSGFNDYAPIRIRKKM